LAGWKPLLSTFSKASPTKLAATICARFAHSWSRNFALPTEPGWPTTYDCDSRPPKPVTSTTLQKNSPTTRPRNGFSLNGLSFQACRHPLAQIGLSTEFSCHTTASISFLSSPAVPFSPSRFPLPLHPVSLHNSLNQSGKSLLDFRATGGVSHFHTHSFSTNQSRVSQCLEMLGEA
jgi:hypothetical protein